MNGCGDSLASESLAGCIGVKGALGEAISMANVCAYKSRSPGNTVVFSFVAQPGWAVSTSYNNNPTDGTASIATACAGSTPTWTPTEAACVGLYDPVTDQMLEWNGSFCVLPNGEDGGLYEAK